jgi:hypothetical protein
MRPLRRSVYGTRARRASSARPLDEPQIGGVIDHRDEHLIAACVDIQAVIVERLAGTLRQFEPGLRRSGRLAISGHRDAPDRREIAAVVDRERMRLPHGPAIRASLVRHRMRVPSVGACHPHVRRAF